MNAANVVPLILLRLQDGHWQVALQDATQTAAGTLIGRSEWCQLAWTGHALPETVIADLRKRFPGVAIKYPG